jgi:hypothetical protein
MNEANELLIRALEELVESDNVIRGEFAGLCSWTSPPIIEAIRTYLANQETAKDAPVAWRTFDGEQGYDYRSFVDNEGYKDEWIAVNGERYKNWVEPLYLHPQETNTVKLYDVPKGSRIKFFGEELTFHHLDGMYSYCTLENGDVVHLACYAPVEVLDE